MKKYLLLTALLANMFAASAQETMYLIKGDKVVGKYAVADVDYAAFTLPEGVQDLPQGSGVVEDKTYMSASPVYLGTDKDCGHFQIQLSTKPITDENPPLELLYLQISTPLITDLKNIQIAEGTYTLGDAEAIAPFKFYPGILLTEGTQQLAAGTVVVNRPDNATTDYILVTDGALSVKMEGTQYTLSGMLKLENGNIVELAYSGPMVVINQSDEQPPVDEEPLPASALTENYTCTPLPSEAYVTNYKNLFADAPRLDYFMLSLYEDSGYANCLDIALVVDREKHPDVLLPKGNYPVFNRMDGSLASIELGTCPAFIVKTETLIANYGCWLTLGYTDKAPLINGYVEVLEDVTSWNNVKIRATLTDNAETPHTVTCEYAGSLMEL